MIRAPCAAASRAYRSCRAIIDSWSPVHRVWTRAARTIRDGEPFEGWDWGWGCDGVKGTAPGSVRADGTNDRCGRRVTRAIG
ncbi:hypothetical protein GCM10009665_40750 [Kitasatospora nipponensis]|uniref:Uncharacterized protein n=1 Tax=Kitasatospora nipponensis TaxID=258049 RepID=A0ABP4H014_9ACTN